MVSCCQPPHLILHMATTPSTHRNTTAAAKDAPCRSAHPPRWYLLIDAKALGGSTERACAPDRQKAQPRTPRPALTCPCKAPREPSIEKMPWAPTRNFPGQLRGSSGSGEHLECPWHAQRCHLIQCAASNQDRPTPIATVNGTARSMAPPIASVTTSRTRCSSLGATSRTSSSWICSSTRERSPCSASP